MNILNEQIIALTESEKNFLLSFSFGLTAIKNKAELLKIINSQLKEFLRFSDSAIFLVNNDPESMDNFLFDLGSPLKESPFCQRIIKKYPVDNRIYDVALDVSRSVIHEFNNIPETHKVIPYLSNSHYNEIKNSRVLRLYRGSVVIGHWVLLYETQPLFEEDQLEFMQLLANQLVVAVLKIKADEVIREREAEGELIQSLNIDFASIRDKNDLLKIIHFKLKKLFEFEHHWVAVINDDQLTMTSFLQDPASRAKNHPQYEHVIKSKYAINDRIFNKVLLSKEPQVFDLDQLSARPNMPQYMQILYESGIKKIVMIGLQVGDSIIGVWAICLVENQNLNARQLNLIKNISNQLSVAVDNIKVNLAIKEKETEHELLLKLSFDITSIRNKDDLIKMINTNLRKLLDFEYIMILVLNGDDTHSLIFSSGAQNNNYNNAGNTAFHNCPDLNQVFESEGIIISDMEQLYHNTTSELIKYEYENGIKEKVTIALRKDGKNMGVFCVNSSSRVGYTDHELELIKCVSYQLSSAVSNILANKEIARRESERELLLSLSIDIAAVRSNNELLQVIRQRLKNVLGFTHTVIATFNDDQTTVSAFLLDPEEKCKNHPIYKAAQEFQHPINDGVLNKAVATALPLVFDLDHLSEEQELPLYLKVNFESGTKWVVVVRFSKGVQVFGFWVLFFEERVRPCESILGLVKALAHQISIAGSNIIANEDVSKREQEKALLLSFSNDIATVRDKLGLGVIIKQYLKNIFLIKEYIITIKNDDGETYRHFLHNLEGDAPTDEGFQIITGSRMPITGSMTGVALRSEEPVIFHIDDIMNQGHLSFPAASFWRSAGAERIMGVRLRVANEDVGILWIQPAQINNHLLNGITAQMAIALANAIANDKIERQLMEIDHYKQQLEEEKVYLKEEIEISHNYAEIVGESPVMQKIFRLVAQVAPSDSTVLLLGETGTGKELIARAIHNNSKRKSKLMVKVNCAALPANLIESELFGHERGSFTGATERRLGKFELANNGTLFLDEIGDMPLELQVKLLRALQEKEIERVGGKGTIKVDVRVIAATNRNLEKEMAEGKFRSDLYYRLNIFPIELPALRNRLEDIPLLASYFIQRFAKKAGRIINGLSSRALQEMLQYCWPGNIRELEHLIERSILLASGETIKQIHLPSQKPNSNIESKDDFAIRTIDENEREYILKILKYCNGRIGGEGGAAQLLGVPASTLNSKIKRLGIKREHSFKN
ncbi:MAG: family ATPase [Mucilaginibacter sp.]|nr:family ATPase [Mucilaginibacter sp.]